MDGFTITHLDKDANAGKSREAWFVFMFGTIGATVMLLETEYVTLTQSCYVLLCRHNPKQFNNMWFKYLLAATQISCHHLQNKSDALGELNHCSLNTLQLGFYQYVR